MDLKRIVTLIVVMLGATIVVVAQEEKNKSPNTSVHQRTP
jgi:hypothetical protein